MLCMPVVHLQAVLRSMWSTCLASRAVHACVAPASCAVHACGASASRAEYGHSLLASGLRPMERQGISHRGWLYPPQLLPEALLAATFAAGLSICHVQAIRTPATRERSRGATAHQKP